MLIRRMLMSVATLALATAMAAGATSTRSTATTVWPRNNSFEVPDLGSGEAAWRYSPSGANWKFIGSSGIAANLSAFRVFGAPRDNHGGVKSKSGQAGFLQGRGVSISQTVHGLPGGMASVKFSIEQRPGGLAKDQAVEVFLGHTLLGKFTTTHTKIFVPEKTKPVRITPGAHLLEFFGTGDVKGNDVTLFLDDVRITVTPK